ncbi:MAG: hypothetical protein PVH91_00140 [Pseudomonadales bacterium]
MYTPERLREENQVFAGTGGVSERAAGSGFVPAFRDDADGRVEIARTQNGCPATMHLFCCLPDEWVTERDQTGQIVALIDSVVAGFVRDGVFYTREEAAQLI